MTTQRKNSLRASLTGLLFLLSTGLLSAAEQSEVDKFVAQYGTDSVGGGEGRVSSAIQS